MLWDAQIDSENSIKSITPIANPTSLSLPSLCHPHIHLDKPFLITSNSSIYEDLNPQNGSFSEALRNTSLAKSRYTDDDLLQRGSQLILESARAGVTSMRAFVEVDHVVEFRCIAVAKQLKAKFKDVCHIQICAFAQDPLFSGESGADNLALMEEALIEYRDVIDVLGSTPYVEQDNDYAFKNIEWAAKSAIEHGLHLDFHLDYNIDPNKAATVWHVIETLNSQDWITHNATKTIALGHCTRLTLFSSSELFRLADAITSAKLPISFIGLPTSDLYMQGRPSDSSPHPSSRPRATLQIISLIKDYGINAAIGINNVGNAFTPWGSTDPIALASMGVGIYQAGTDQDAETLYECVSVRARKAIGLASDLEDDLELKHEQDLRRFGTLLIKNVRNIEVSGLTVVARQRRTVRDVVWDPPEIGMREIIWP